MTEFASQIKEFASKSRFGRVANQWIGNAWRKVSPIQNPAWSTSAVVHAAALVILALVIIPIPDGNAIQILLFEDVEAETADSLETLEDITVDIELSSPVNDPLEFELIETNSSTELVSADMLAPVEINDLALSVSTAGDFDLPSPESLLLDVGKVKPQRQINDKVSKLNLDKSSVKLAELTIPQNAVHSGSFTVFSEPADPVDGRPYWLIVQLQLPLHMKERKSLQNDVTGLLIGSDGFQMTIPSGPAFYIPVGNRIVTLVKPPAIRDQYHYADRQARWAVWVPGASKSVRDVVRVRSKLLKQQHTLNLEF